MSGNRAGETGNIPQREERFHFSNGDWFFATREGCLEGPFDDKAQASRGLREFLEFLATATPRVPV